MSKKLLKLYNLNYTLLGILNDESLTSAKTITKTENINNIATLSFDISLDSDKWEYIINNNIVEWEDELYKIKALDFSHTSDKKVITVNCEHMSTNLQGYICPQYKIYGKTARELLTYIINRTAILTDDTGTILSTSDNPVNWSVGTVDIPDTDKRSLEAQQDESVFSNLVKIANYYEATLYFHSKIVNGSIVNQVDLLKTKSDRSIQIRTKKNLKELKITYGEDSPIITRLYAYGGTDEISQQEISIASAYTYDVNGNITTTKYGKVYTEDYSWFLAQGYSQDYIDAHPELFLYETVWRESTYIDAQDLYKDAIIKLSKVSKPKVNCSVQILDLNDVPDYFVQSPQLGELVYIIDEDLNLSIQAQVVQITQNSDDPLNLTIGISNEVEYNSILSTLADTSALVQKTTNGVGEIKGYYIQDATIHDAKITNLSASKITTDTMSADRISGGTLTLGGGSNGNGVASIKDTNSNEIVRLDNTGILVNNGKITIKNNSNTTILDGAGINASTINSGTLNANLISVTNLNASNITSGTMTADKINGGTLTLGGTTNGVESVKDSNGNEIVRLDTTGISVTNGKISVKDSGGTTILNGSGINASYINTGVLDASKANITNINASSINTGMLSANTIGARTITADKIATGTITASSAVIADGAISNAMISDGAINNAKISNASISTAQIQTGAITNALISTGAVQTAQIADGSITDAKIVGLTANKITAGTIDASNIEVINLKASNLTVGTINGTQISSGAIDTTKLTTSLNNTINTAYTNASTALTNASTAQTTADSKNTVFYSITAPSTTGRKVGDTWFDTDDGNKVYKWSGSAWTATQFGTNAIANSSITNALITDATIQSAKIANLDASKITTGVLSADRIASNTITADKIATGAVTAGKIATDAIVASNITGATITGDKLVMNTITAREIASKTITANEIVSNTITGNEIASNTITANHIQADTITTDKLASNVGGTLDLSSNVAITSKVTQADVDNSINAIQIGGRNLLLNSTGNLGISNWASGIVSETKYNYTALKISNATTAELTKGSTRITLKPNTTYTISFYITADSNLTNSDMFLLCRKVGSVKDWDYASSKYITPSTTGYDYITWQYTTPSDVQDGYIRLDNNGTKTLGTASNVWFSRIQIEEGNKPTTWTPAPEDVQYQIDSATSRISTAESSITQLGNSISLKVDTGTFNSYKTTNDNAVTSLDSRLDSAELKITDTAIVSTVRSSSSYTGDLNAKSNKSTLISEINQSAEAIKISASKVDIIGAVTFSSLDSSTQTMVTNGNNALSSAQDYTNSAMQLSNIDNTQSTLFHFDENLCSTNGVNPSSGYVATLRKDEGKFGGAVAVEEGTTNLLTNNEWTVAGGNKTDALPEQPAFSVIIKSHISKGDWNDLFNVNYSTPITLNNGESFTISGWFYVKGNKGTFNCQINTDTSTNLPVGNKSAVYGWNYLVWTYTNTTGSTRIISHTRVESYLVSGGTGWDNNDNETWGCNYQIEKKSFSTSFINGTRTDGVLEYPTSLISGGDFTINMWIKPNGLGNSINSSQRLISTGDDITTSLVTVWNYYPTITDSLNRRFIMDGGNNASSVRQYRDLNDSTLFNINLWEMFTLVFDSINLKLKTYRNGNLWASLTLTKVNSINHFKIIKANWLIDEMLVAKKVLSDSDISTIYNMQQPFYDPNPKVIIPKPTSVTMTLL